MFIAEKWGCLYLYLDVKSEQPTYSLNTSQYIRINPNLVKTSNVVTILVRQTKKMLVRIQSSQKRINKFNLRTPQRNIRLKSFSNCCNINSVGSFVAKEKFYTFIFDFNKYMILYIYITLHTLNI